MRNAAYLLLYGALYFTSLIYLSRDPAFVWAESLAVFLIFGVILSGIAGLLTRNATKQTVLVLSPRKELRWITLYLLLFSIFVLGYGFTYIKQTMVAAAWQETTLLLLKLFSMVLLPALLLKRHGYTWRELLQWRWPSGHASTLFWMLLLLGGLQLLLGRGLHELQKQDFSATTLLLFSVPALIWMSVEAGLCEEYLFRYLLQTRLAAVLKSEVGAIVLMALIFGLAHAPGYYWRDAYLNEGLQHPPDLIGALVYSIAVVSPVGLVFGLLWARTGHFWLLVLLHGWVDWLPNLSPFIRTWL